MIQIKRLGRMRINNRKRLESCSLFKCPKCGSLVIRPTGEGNRLTACSQSCSQLGVRRKSYKKSVIISGYEYVYMPEHPNAMKSGYVGKHRLVLENKLGRFLKNNEVAHHVNENKLDNSPENIELMSFSEHSRLHAKEKWEERGGFVKIQSVE